MAGSIKSALLVWFQYEILNEIISANNKGFIKKIILKIDFYLVVMAWILAADVCFAVGFLIILVLVLIVLVVMVVIVMILEMLLNVVSKYSVVLS